jgi:hypothetical protein
MTSVPTHNNPNNTFLISNNLLKYVKHDTCRKSKKIIPNLKPYINELSQYSSLFNTYVQIYVHGENFFPNGQTTVNFGNIQKIPINFINSNTFYFELQNLTFPGVYNIVVNNNISFNALSKTANTGGVLLQSNAIQYTIA